MSSNKWAVKAHLNVVLFCCSLISGTRLFQANGRAYSVDFLNVSVLGCIIKVFVGISKVSYRITFIILLPSIFKRTRSIIVFHRVHEHKLRECSKLFIE